MTTPDRAQQDLVQAEKEKRGAALSSVVAAVLLTTLKLVVGGLTGSLGILAEAAHSALDLVAALVTFFAVRLSDQPPDEGHTYGHGKVENLSALVETLLLLITCVWIIYEAVQRLFFETVDIEVSVWAFGVMIISIVVDVTRSRILYAAARKHSSQALEADALHFSTDIWSSTVVIAGLGFVWLSERLGPQWAWLSNADAVAALAVAMIVIYVSLQLGRRAIAVLLDAAPTGLVSRIEAQAGSVPGVQSVGPVRVRQAGAHTFVDLTVAVARSASLEESHAVASAVEQRVAQLLHHGDVVVHVDPVQPAGESLPQTASALAALLGLRAHNIHVHEVLGQFHLDLHVEVPPHMTLAQAHDRVSQFEDALHRELPYVHQVQTHIEPGDVPADVTGAEVPDEDLKTWILELMRDISGLNACHDVQVRHVSEGYDIVLHCLVDPALPVTEAHRLAGEAERRIQIAIPGVSEVLVHIEPE